MPDRKAKDAINDRVITLKTSLLLPLNYTQLRKEETNNESDRQHLIKKYNNLSCRFATNHSEEIAIMLIGLRKVIDLIGANEREIIDAQYGIKRHNDHEYID